jgi:hypothetical protein
MWGEKLNSVKSQFLSILEVNPENINTAMETSSQTPIAKSIPQGIYLVKKASSTPFPWRLASPDAKPQCVCGSSLP